METAASATSTSMDLTTHYNRAALFDLGSSGSDETACAKLLLLPRSIATALALESELV